jgi:hypothetical protein
MSIISIYSHAYRKIHDHTLSYTIRLYELLSKLKFFAKLPRKSIPFGGSYRYALLYFYEDRGTNLGKETKRKGRGKEKGKKSKGRRKEKERKRGNAKEENEEQTNRRRGKERKREGKEEERKKIFSKEEDFRIRK